MPAREQKKMSVPMRGTRAVREATRRGVGDGGAAGLTVGAAVGMSKGKGKSKEVSAAKGKAAAAKMGRVADTKAKLKIAAGKKADVAGRKAQASANKATKTATPSTAPFLTKTQAQKYKDTWFRDIPWREDLAREMSGIDFTTAQGAKDRRGTPAGKRSEEIAREYRALKKKGSK